MRLQGLQSLQPQQGFSKPGTDGGRGSGGSVVYLLGVRVCIYSARTLRIVSKGTGCKLSRQ